MQKGNEPKIIKIKDYDNEGGMTADEADAELKKRGLVPPTMEWWMSLTDEEAKKYAAYAPIYLGRNKNGLGLAARGYYGYDVRRYVYLYWRPSSRAGVLGMKQDKPQPPISLKEIFGNKKEYLRYLLSNEDELRKAGWIKDTDWGDIAPNYIKSNVFPKRVREELEAALATPTPNIMHLLAQQAGWTKGKPEKLNDLSQPLSSNPKCETQDCRREPNTCQKCLETMCRNSESEGRKEMLEELRKLKEDIALDKSTLGGVENFGLCVLYWLSEQKKKEYQGLME